MLKHFQKSKEDLFIYLEALDNIDVFNPNFSDIAKALLLPGIPILNLNVGFNVFILNSVDAFNILLLTLHMFLTHYNV